MKTLNVKRATIINLVMILFIGLIQIQAQTAKTVKVSSTTKNTSKEQKEEIENIVRNYLLKNPSIIREVLQALQIQEARERQELTAKNLKSLENEIFADANSPTAGNARGDISIVAFFDYNCGHCKRSLPALKELLAKDPSVRVVYKEYPILSLASQLGAKAALAAGRQGKYVEFHDALLEAGEITDEMIKSISDQLGLNYERLLKDMKDEAINQMLSDNYRLAGALGIEGTPAYIVGTQFIPGAVDLISLTSIVKTEREKLKEANRSIKK